MTEARSGSEGLAAKTVKSSAYSIGASAVTIVLGFGRSVLMARLLAPEDFGVVAFALTLLNFTAPLRDFGIDQALIHRKPDEETTLGEVLAVHFSMRLILIALFALLLLAATPVLGYFYPQKTMLVPVLLALTMGDVASALGATPTNYLRKDMRFRDLAVLQVLTSLSMTIVGPLLAWQNLGVWAIVGERISGVIVAAIAVWGLFRPWRLQLRFNWELIKWYLNYGKFVWATQSLNKLISEFDDFWIGTVLSSQALGFYSKAYEFANYPRRVVSDPIVQVLFPTFARVQDDRLRLSKAYFRTFSLVSRVGFLFAGALVFGAPFFVPFLLGEQWRPMTVTFQLMIVYTLLDPLLAISNSLLTAVGYPRFTTRARFFQGLFFVPAVIGAAYWKGINGVALATDAMLLLGLALLLYQLKRVVDFSLYKMLGPPALALGVGAVIGMGIGVLAAGDELLTVAENISGFILGYGLTLLILERRYYSEHVRAICHLLPGWKTGIKP